ncbi:caspase family protein [Flavilitoribacter nigricans]|uniref:Peptidase C14 caspase domain-containing protein n=1 Tax=Flavilitoribacter nigricans (strain ATCC 23147 / DSM 23189 / NBRC 102662 / NCIMB 1420 / SS-2) TaxID=1122177 RepID=A0A2D0MY75_FLAN2|nr:caspase family protein [Flavilitoribacter nigricans]PHN01195.1 hypothetical protein CRP01_38285 [Flavilitoribacter nigricans DSM 23189 = NBRC 102662]
MPNGIPWATLNNAVYDAARVTELLLERYRFHRPDDWDNLAAINGQEIRQYNSIRTRCLYNEQATRANIFTHINAVKNSIGEQDALLIYFSGHGVSRNGLTYLVPYGVNQEQDFDWVNWGEVIARFGDYETDKKCADLLLVLDCCFAGTITRGQVFSNRDYYSRYVLTASGSQDEASDGPPGAGGPFANKFLDILTANTRPFASMGQLNAANALSVYFAMNGLDQQAHYGLLPNVKNGQGEFVLELAEQNAPPVALLGKSILDYLDFELQRGILSTHFKSRYRPINLISTFGSPFDAHKLLGKVLFRWLFDEKISGRIPLSDAGLRYLEIHLTKLGGDDIWGNLVRMLAPRAAIRDFTPENCVEWIFDQVREGALSDQSRHLVIHFHFEVGSTELFQKLEQFYLDFQTHYIPLFQGLSQEEKMKIGRVFILFSDERPEADFTPFSPDQQEALLQKFGPANLNFIAPDKIGKINQNHIYAWVDNTKVLIQTNAIQQMEPTDFFDPFADDVAFEIDDFIDKIIDHCGISAEALMGFLFDFQNKAVYD